jgi:hypothetical protein
VPSRGPFPSLSVLKKGCDGALPYAEDIKCLIRMKRLHWVEVKASVEKYLSIRPYPSPEDMDMIVTVYEDEWGIKRPPPALA